jgi:hypothetical protein
MNPVYAGMRFQEARRLSCKHILVDNAQECVDPA